MLNYHHVVRLVSPPFFLQILLVVESDPLDYTVSQVCDYTLLAMLQPGIGLVILPRSPTFIGQTWGWHSTEPSAYVSP